jgi:transposase InsO family protein
MAQGSWAFTTRAKQSGLVPSMGSIGDCYDNAVIESFWSRMQVELLDRQRWRTRLELANAMSTTSESSPTAAAGTPPSAGSHPSSREPDNDHRGMKSSNRTPRNPGHTRSRSQPNRGQFRSPTSPLRVLWETGSTNLPRSGGFAPSSADRTRPRRTGRCGPARGCTCRDGV